MKTKLFFGMLTAAATLAVTPAVFADEATAGSVTGLTGNDGSTTYTDSGTGGTYETNTGSTTIGTVSKKYERNLSGYWTSASITTTGTVGGYGITITGANDGGTYTTDQDLYFTGEGTLTITDLTVSNGSAANRYSTTKAFIVEGTTVILSGVTVEELGMNLIVGTEYEAGDATLVITNGSKVTTSAYYNNVGANLNTGTITISEGSTLATQQITLGCGVNSLFAYNETNVGDYWTKCFVEQTTFEAIRDSLFTGEYTGSYGIVNVESGSTFSVGVGNKDTSNNKFQLSNGELNIDGAGSQMIIGENSRFLLMGEQAFTDTSASHTYSVMTGMYLTEKISVTNGGKLTNEAGTKVEEIYLGDDFLASNTTVDILVSGKDEDNTASTFDLAASDSVVIGTVIGYDYTYSNGKMDGGTMDVTIKATEGGVFKATADCGIYVCADNYASYLLGVSTDNVGHSYGIDVKLSAESGGSLTLDANGSDVFLAAGSPTESYENTLTITADGTSEDGTASSVTISGGDIYTNYGNDGTEGAESVSVEITAKNGGTIALKAATVADTGATGVISFGLNTKVTVEEGSSLTTGGKVLFNAGSSISVDATSTWTTESSVTFSAGSGIEIGAVANENGNAVNIAVGEVTISESASISVYVDVSQLSADTTTFTVNLMTGTFDVGFDADAFSNEAGNLFAKFSDETNWEYEYGLALEDDSTLQLVVSRTYLPEPSMFSLLFGLGALGLVGTRRRRR